MQNCINNWNRLLKKIRGSIYLKNHKSIIELSELFTFREKNRLFRFVILQSSLGILDLFGILLIGLLGSLAVTENQSLQQIKIIPGLGVLDKLFHDKTQGETLLYLGFLAIIVLILKTCLTLLLTRRIIQALSRKGAGISNHLVTKFLETPFENISRWPSQDILFTITRGVEYLTIQVFSSGVILLADISLLLILFFGLMIINPVVAFALGIMFCFVGYLLYYLMHLKAANLGELTAQLTIESNNSILKPLIFFREMTVTSRKANFTENIMKNRMKLAEVSAETNFLPYISKYLIETTVVVGAVIIAGFEFVQYGTAQAVASLAIFMASGSRIAPAVLRIQQGYFSISNGLAVSSSTIKLLSDLKLVPTLDQSKRTTPLEIENFIPTVMVKNLSFNYENSKDKILDSIDFTISAGEHVLITGASGVGKSTLVDLLLGVLVPTQGEVIISGLTPKVAVDSWPGAIGYVPQSISIMDDSVLSNVALGIDIQHVQEENIYRALELSGLGDFISKLPSGIHTKIGDGGFGISGGQRQRIGIARALYSEPKLLILDEATNALDQETENEVIRRILSMENKLTVISITHTDITQNSPTKIINISGKKVHISNGNLGK